MAHPAGTKHLVLVSGVRGGRAAPNLVLSKFRRKTPFNGAALLFWDYIPELAGPGNRQKKKMLY